MEKEDIKLEIKNWGRDELEENLIYLIMEMDDEQQKEFMGVQ